MLRIGEAAKQFSISNRTLRHWESAGILKSTRAENGYRHYDRENMARINQIVMLRRLKMPIADIERIFIDDGVDAVYNALCSHLETIRQDASVYHALIAFVERLVSKIRDAENPAQVFSCLEEQYAAFDSRHDYVPQILLSERETLMEKLNNVRIVRLPAMTVASYRAESASPENDCAKIFSPFVLENNLHKRDGYRNFGFNNPSPSEGSPVYGYEMWVTVPEAFTVPAPLVKKQFGGGLYASVSAAMSEIGERWGQLHAWCEGSDRYNVDFSHQWLEECSMDYETFISAEIPDGEKQLDLLEPIVAK
ncbi:MAG: MerR family transcriptional regulator [Oscillospiraceae bacterium]|nr:MerR family transcriptional regulator [Oscillospiraceae bacterium]